VAFTTRQYLNFAHNALTFLKQDVDEGRISADIAKFKAKGIVRDINAAIEAMQPQEVNS